MATKASEVTTAKRQSKGLMGGGPLHILHLSLQFGPLPFSSSSSSFFLDGGSSGGLVTIETQLPSLLAESDGVALVRPS